MTDFRPTEQQMRFVSCNFQLFSIPDCNGNPELRELLLDVAKKGAKLKLTKPTAVNEAGTVSLYEIAKTGSPKHKLLMACIEKGEYFTQYASGIGYSESFMRFLAQQVLPLARVNTFSGITWLSDTMPTLPCDRPAKRPAKRSTAKAAQSATL